MGALLASPPPPFTADELNDCYQTSQYKDPEQHVLSITEIEQIHGIKESAPMSEKFWIALNHQQVLIVGSSNNKDVCIENAKIAQAQDGANNPVYIMEAVKVLQRPPQPEVEVRDL